MKGQDMFRGMQYLDSKFIEKAEFGTFSKEAFYKEADSRLHLKRVFLLAAVIALISLLVGCGIVYVLKMQELKLGDRQVTQEYWDESIGGMICETVQTQVLTFSGLKGSAGYEAAGEWYQFQQTYDPDWKRYHENEDSEDPWRAPAEYGYYNIYTPDMAAKIYEITQKYGLKPAGAPVKAISSNALLSYLGLNGIFREEAEVSHESIGTSYYEGGLFHTDMHMKLENRPDWPYQFLCSLYYCPKDCFDNSLCTLNTANDWQEWNYTTASGHNVLVIRSPSVWVSWVFCDRGDATVTLRLETILEWYGDEDVTKISMTDDQLKAVLDTVDFSITPQPGDPALLAGPNVSTNAVQTHNGCTVEVKDVFTDGHKTAIALGITAPEDVDLEQYLDQKNLRFAFLNFTPLEGLDSLSGSRSAYIREDKDGKANTVDYFIEIEEHAREGMAFPEGSVCRLYLETLRVQEWDDQLSQMETVWSLEGVWNFEIPLNKGDWRELEFVSDPITTEASTGWDRNGNDVFRDVTITSLKLRAFGGAFTSTWELGGLDLCDYRTERFPQVILKDGSVIQLGGNLAFWNTEDEGKPIPLDQVDHIVLMDGTMLTPVQ